MSCERFRETVAGLAAGAEVTAAGAAHLAGCGACAAELARQRRLLAEVDAELERTLGLTASPGFTAGVARRVRRGDPGQAPWARQAAWIGLAAAAAIAAAIWLRTPAVPPAAPTQQASVSANPAPRGIAEGVTARPVDRGGVGPAAPARAARPTPRILHATAIEDPPVLVDPDQARAIARLHELLAAGRLTEKVLPPPQPHEVAELTIAPLEVAEIAVPDVEMSVPGAGSGRQER